MDLWASWLFLSLIMLYTFWVLLGAGCCRVLLGAVAIAVADAFAFAVTVAFAIAVAVAFVLLCLLRLSQIAP